MANLPLILIASKNTALIEEIQQTVPDVFCITTANGEEALHHTLHHKLNVIVVDSDLNEMSGYEVTLLLLGAYHSKDIPVILIAPDNDKTAKWKKFNQDTKNIPVLSPDLPVSGIAMEIKRFLNLMVSSDMLSCSVSLSSDKKIILAVDDMTVNLMALEIVIKKLGHILYTAKSGIEAIELCKEHQFDLIFMDCQMPEMDGFQATAAIKKHYAATKHNVPIVALTAHAHRADRQKCLQSGMHDYLTKPVIKNQIIQTINKWTSSK